MQAVNSTLMVQTAMAIQLAVSFSHQLSEGLSRYTSGRTICPILSSVSALASLDRKRQNGVNTFTTTKVASGTCQQIMPLVLSSNALVTAENLWVSMETRLGIKAVDPHLPLTPTPRHPPARRLPPLATALSLQDQSYNPSAHLQLSLRAPARAQQAQA